MKRVLFVLVAALMAVGCLDYAKAPSGVKMEPQGPEQVGPEAECVESIDCPAGFTCDQGECVVSKPESPALEPDVILPQADTFEGEPDTEMTAPEVDTATGGVDISVPSSTDTTSNPDSSPPAGEDAGEGDTIQPGADTVAPNPDVEVLQPDIEQPQPDTAQSSPDTETPSPDVETPAPDAAGPSPDSSPQGGEDVSDDEASSPSVEEDGGEGDASEASSDTALESETTEESDTGEPACVPVAEICGNAVDEDCDGEDVPCPPPEPNKVAIAVDDPDSESLSLQTDVTINGPLGWETYEDTVSPFGWDLEIGPSDSESELYRLNFFRKPAGDWVCQVPFGGVPTCLVLPTLSVDGEVIEVEDFTDRVIIPAGVAALMCDPRYEVCAVANIGYCRGEQACEIACDNGEDDDGDGLIDLVDPHCN